jgi:hypothetical protein
MPPKYSALISKFSKVAGCKINQKILFHTEDEDKHSCEKTGIIKSQEMRRKAVI